MSLSFANQVIAMIIDIHTHTFPDRIAAAALTKMQGDSHTVTFSDGTASGLVRSMAEAGIHRSVVLPVATNPAKVASINDVSLALTGRDGLIYFGCVHPEMEDPLGELERISALGLKGIKLHPVYQGVDIDDPRFLRILGKAAELGLVVVTHSGDDIGFPGVVRCSPEMTRNALKQVGEVKLVLAHMGGWRNWERVTDCLADTCACLDTAFSLGALTPLNDYYSPEERKLLSSEAFCGLVKAFGAERILFGTDSPWTSQLDSKKDIEALPLSEAEKAAILGGNAERLLGLGASC